jgi:hypothetical protein
MNAFVPAERTVPVPTAKLNLFNYKEPVNVELSARVTQKVYPLAAITPDTDFCDFYFSPSHSMFMDFSSLTLNVTGQFVNLDGTKIVGEAQGDVFIPKSFFKRALFKSVEVSINETPILGSLVHWQCVDSIVHALQTGYSNVQTTETLDRVYFDSEIMEPSVELDTQQRAVPGTDPAKQEYILTENSGAIRRQAFEDTRKSQVFVVKGSLLPPNLHNLNYFPNNLSVRVRLTRNTPEMYIIEKVGGANGKCTHRFEIQQIFLEMDYLALTSKCHEGLERSFDLRAAEIPFSNIEEYQVLIPAQITEFRQDRILSGLLPSHVIGVFVKTANLAGNSKQDPTSFGHFNIAELELVTDQDFMFAHQLIVKADFSTSEGYAEAFHKLSKEIENTEAAKFFTKNKFVKNGAIFIFRMIPEHLGSVDFGFPRPVGTVGIRGRFSTPVQEPLTLLLYTIRNSRIQISGTERIVSVLS